MNQDMTGKTVVTTVVPVCSASGASPTTAMN
jgi:hypothetical protein